MCKKYLRNYITAITCRTVLWRSALTNFCFALTIANIMSESTPQKNLKMPDKENKYPRETGQRRLRAGARPDYRDRRTAERYQSSFPVTIYIGGKGSGKVYQAIAKNISGGGLLLGNVNIPETEKRIHVDFSIPDGTVPEEYQQGKFSLEGQIVNYNKEKATVGVLFDKGLFTYLAGRMWLFMRWAAVLIGFLALSLILLTKIENLYFFWFDVPVLLYSITVGTYLISRFLFAMFYKPPKKQDVLPSVTIVIPAFNEEDVIEETIVHALEVSYPGDKIQVIVVNDGSRDKTLAVMKRVGERYPDLVIVDLGKNRGKRYALSVGARMSKSDIVVFIDSDSFLDRAAIRNIIDGFANPKVAAICGHCEVANTWTNLLTKMQAVRYFIGFRVLKAAESVFDSVTCLSGPLAAYRRSVIIELMDKWVNQTFLGAPATYGDDRSLTNFILPHHKILYDFRARCRTVVPDGYMQFFKQQMRWKRSWFRESIRASAFLWRKQPLMSLSFYLGFILPVLGPAIVFRAMIYVPLFQNGTPLNYIFGILLMSMLMSTAYLFIKRSKIWFYGIPFCFFYMFVLVWQLPWAILTFRETKWGTRA